MMSEQLNPRRVKRVTRAQLELLWVFLSCHKQTAIGVNKTLDDREKFRRLWMRVANDLNGLDGGGVRDWKGWAKYWIDYKAKLKRKDSEGLTEIETKFMTLINSKPAHLSDEPLISNEDMPSSPECNNEIHESNTSLDGYAETNTDIKHISSSNVMEKLVDVLRDIHKTLVRIEEKLPTFETVIRDNNDNSTLF